jgi:hypothetical protein
MFRRRHNLEHPPHTNVSIRSSPPPRPRPPPRAPRPLGRSCPRHSPLGWYGGAAAGGRGGRPCAPPRRPPPRYSVRACGTTVSTAPGIGTSTRRKSVAASAGRPAPHAAVAWSASSCRMRVRICAPLADGCTGAGKLVGRELLSDMRRRGGGPRADVVQHEPLRADRLGECTGHTLCVFAQFVTRPLQRAGCTGVECARSRHFSMTVSTVRFAL